MRIPVLAAVLMAVMVAAAWADEPAVIEPQALAERVASADSQLLVLDVRSAAEFDEGHIPGAINIPFDAIDDRIAELGPSGQRDVVVYCRSGRRSAIALTTLKEAGFSRLFHLEGDYLRWSEEARTIVRPPAQP
jgi:rhodanese-related sulfurtransferase